MAGENRESLHILSLIINRRQDIPLVRAKVKLLASAAGAARLSVTQLATAASEMSRLLWQRYGGGRVDLVIIHAGGAEERTGIELRFEGRKSPLSPADPDLALSPEDIREQFAGLPPVRGARSMLDAVEFEQGRGEGEGHVRIRCLKWGVGLSWEELQQLEGRMRKDLFAGTSESYVENLRVKHEEVLKLLREKSVRTKELDRANAELVLMSRMLEEMAGERTMMEMSLRIADRIRNPATVIGGLAGQLAAKGGGDEKEKQRLAALKGQAGKLEEAVRDFDLLAARAQNLFQEEELGGIIQDALSLCVSLGRKKIRANVLLPGGKVTVHANRRTLTVALLGIVRHAAELTVAGGELSVTMAIQENRPCITVSYAVKSTATPKELAARDLALNLAGQILAAHQGAMKLQGRAAAGETQSIEVSLPLYWQESGLAMPAALT